LTYHLNELAYGPFKLHLLGSLNELSTHLLSPWLKLRNSWLVYEDDANDRDLDSADLSIDHLEEAISQ
jgi:hypothetical protein